MRILFFPGYLVLASFMIIPPLLAYSFVCLNKLNINRYYGLFHKYYILVVVVLGLMGYCDKDYEKIKSSLIFLPAGLCFAFKPKMPWHKHDIWTYHEYFHLLLLLCADLYSSFIH